MRIFLIRVLILIGSDRVMKIYEKQFPNLYQAVGSGQLTTPDGGCKPKSTKFSDFQNHIKPDLVLIYRKPDDAVLQLVRLGSHSELGL
jgi:hypothetical protein